MARSTPNLYPVALTPEQRASLIEVTRNGYAPVRKIRHAQVLLWSDVSQEGERLSSRAIGERLGMHVNTVDRIRKRFAMQGVGPAINRKVRVDPPVPPKIDGAIEAHLIAICCGPAPEGRARWTLKLLAGELKRKGLVTHVCAETVRKTLKKTSCSLGASKAGVFLSGTKLGSSRRWRTSSTSTRRSMARKSR